MSLGSTIIEDFSILGGEAPLTFVNDSFVLEF